MIKLSAFADEYSDKLDEQIEGLKKNGISYLEIRFVDGISIIDLTEEQAKGYAARLDAAGIKVWSIGSPVGKYDINIDWDEYTAKVHHICKLAQIFSCPRIRMFSFFNAYENAERVCELLRETVRIGNMYGIDMCHENEKDIYGDVADRVLVLRDHVPGLKFVYDPANFAQCNQDCMEAMDKLFDLCEYFHIKDVDIATGALVPAGCGDCRIDNLVSRIQKDTVLTIEPHLAVFSAYNSIDTTEMKHRYCYESNQDAFNAAVAAIKKILNDCGYKEENGAFVKENV